MIFVVFCCLSAISFHNLSFLIQNNFLLFEKKETKTEQGKEEI